MEVLGKLYMRAIRENMEKKIEESYAEHSLVSLDVPSATEERVRYGNPSVVVHNPPLRPYGENDFSGGHSKSA